MNESNALLAQRFHQQDETAFTQLVGRHHSLVFSVCLRILGHRQDAEDAVSLYQLLQDQIVPLFYDRDDSGIPLGWLQLMKEAMASTGGAFSSNRMVADYVSKAYVPLGL